MSGGRATVGKPGCIRPGGRAAGTSGVGWVDFAAAVRPNNCGAATAGIWIPDPGILRVSIGLNGFGGNPKGTAGGGEGTSGLGGDAFAGNPVRPRNWGAATVGIWTATPGSRPAAGGPAGRAGGTWLGVTVGAGLNWGWGWGWN